MMFKDTKAIKKFPLSFFAVFLVTALFFSGIYHGGIVRTAEASFLDTIVAFVTINPLRVRIEIPAEVEVGRNFKAEVTVENRGDKRISNLEVEIFISEGLVLVNKDVSKEIGQVSGNREKKVSWQVKGTETGNFSVSVQASGKIGEDAVGAEGNTAVVTIKEKSPPGKPAGQASPPINIFQSFFSFFQRWF